VTSVQEHAKRVLCSYRRKTRQIRD